MIFVFVKLAAVCLGLASLAVSLLTWRDGVGKTAGPAWWTAGYAAFTVAGALWLLPSSPLTTFVQLVLLYAAIALEYQGFARFHRIGSSWIPALTLLMSLALAWVASFPLDNNPQAQILVLAAFCPLFLGGVLVQLAFVSHRGRVIPWLGFGTIGMLLTGAGTLRFIHGLAWDGAWAWYLTDPGQYLTALVLVLDLAVLVQYQLRVVNRRYLDQIGGLDRELAQSQREILVTLAEVIENSSHETAGHVTRVGAYASLLARTLGRGEAEVRLLGEAAHLHDIGKIGIPERILEQDGPLAREDFQTMKTHTTIGHGILARSDRPLFRMAARIALEHHENWDGTGYPRGLRGHSISLEGRIVALCDVFDALSQRRTYKEPWPLDQIFDHIAAERGRKFDPELVDLWLAHRDRIQSMAEASLPRKVAVPVA